MSMITYEVRANFILTVVDPAHSMGITLKRGETLQYDGYLVSYNGINSGSPSLKAAIREGWLAEVGSSKQAAVKPGAKVDESVLVSKASIPSGANQTGMVTSKATSAGRGMPVSKMEGTVIKNTTFGEKKSAEETVPERKKMGFLREEEQQRVINVDGISAREDRVFRHSDSGDVIFTSKRATVAKESFMLDGSDEATPGSGDRVINTRTSRRLVPAKQTTEVTDATPLSEAAADQMAYRDANMDNGVSEAPSAKELIKLREVEVAVAQQALVAAHAVVAPKKKKASMIADVVAVSPKTIIGKHGKGVKLAQLELPPIEVEQPAPKRRALSSNPGKELAASKAGTAVSVDQLSVNGEPWNKVHYSNKVEFVKTIVDAGILNELTVHKSSHPLVRKMAKARLQELSA